MRGYADLGDQLFVDKFSYNLLGPHRADVFVFRTNGILGIPPGPNLESEHYIKRLAGMPGDTLRIQQPKLFVNGQEATDYPFRACSLSAEWLHRLSKCSKRYHVFR